MPLLRLRRPGIARKFVLLGIVGAAGLSSLLLSPASVSAKQGIVTAGGQNFEGDIDETSKPGSVIITTKEGAKVIIDRRSVEKRVFFDTPRQEFDARLGAATKDDINARIALAQWAIAGKHYDMAREALASARQIDPANAQVTSLTQQVDKEAPVAPPATQAAGAADAAPTTRPGFARRQVTPEEINLIRQMEWKRNDMTVKPKVPPDVRKQFIDLGIMPVADAQRLSQFDLANAILKDGTAAMRSQVLLTNDPQPMAYFRQHVQKVLSTGCATCHAPDKAATAGGYVLFPGDADAAAYSNFLILQKTEIRSGGVEREMVDRTRPQGSLLLDYLLPPELVENGHPKAGGYKGAVKGKIDPHYAAIGNWIQSLSPLPPNYDSIDLTAEAAKPATPSKGAGAKGAAPAAAVSGAVRP